MSHQLYWGDLHNHCSISYGHSTIEQALARAAQQLDFCSVTGHAFWPDMPTDRAVYGPIIDYHHEGFARLARNWPKLIAAQAAATVPGQFIAFPSYEWHSLKYGDHNMYAMGPNLELRDAPDLPALRALAAKTGAIIIPHHIGYEAGYRGINWQHYLADRSPFVEIFSLHGCSESAQAPYPMLHDMGPRDSGSTAEAGWDAGHRFGIIASSDHHGAYPGSHGDGRMGVFAKSHTREGIWEAFLARRVYAVTGDKIDARLWVDDAFVGESFKSSKKRRIRATVAGSDALDYAEILKNGRVLRRLWPEPSQPSTVGRFRLRVTWGWGRKDKTVDWTMQMSVKGGRITGVETCFAGEAVVAPKLADGDAESPDAVDLPHEILDRSESKVAWRSVTSGNLTMRHDTTQAISFEVELDAGATFAFEINGHQYRHEAGELLNAVRSHYMRGWLSEAVQIGPLVPLADCRVEAEFDDAPERDVDIYRLRVAQKNGQWAWLTPLWAER